MNKLKREKNFSFTKPCLVAIFKRLTTNEIHKFGRVNKRWNLVATSALVWKKRFEENFVKPVEDYVDMDTLIQTVGPWIPNTQLQIKGFWESYKLKLKALAKGDISQFGFWDRSYHRAQQMTTEFINKLVWDCQKNSLMIARVGEKELRNFRKKYIEILLQTDPFIFGHIGCKNQKHCACVTPGCSLATITSGATSPGAMYMLKKGVSEMMLDRNETNYIYARTIRFFKQKDIFAMLFDRPRKYKGICLDTNLNNKCTLLTQALKCYLKCPTFYGPQIEMLLKYGANPNKTDLKGDTPLVCCIANSGRNVYKNMLDMYNVQAVNKQRTADRDTTKIVNTMLYLGADPNKPNKYGTHPLMLAYKLQNETVVGMLLKRNANPYVKNKRGRTLIDHNQTLANKKIKHYQEDIDTIYFSFQLILVALFLCFVFYLWNT